MDVIRCKNGHFFDGDSYDKCPHCGEAAIAGGSNTTSPKEEKKGFWGHSKRGKGGADSRQNPTPPSSYAMDYDNGSSPTEVSDDNRSPVISSVPPKSEHTLDFWQTSSHPKNTSESMQGMKDEADRMESENGTSTDITHDKDTNIRKGAVDSENQQDESASASSLMEAVKNASANNEGKTMSYFSSATAPSASQNQIRQPAEPVVGWLVCIGGIHFGECFSIYAGKNSIGRSLENRVVIADDNSISRIKHALIVYEPKKRNFYLQPGDSSGLTYLNDDYITESHKLSAHDMIELGDSKFMFVPLCGEAFSWEEYMPKGE